jgi:hypothetical protein
MRSYTKIEEADWRKLCTRVADEPDPERLSELVEHLIVELDALREQLDQSGHRLSTSRSNQK